MSRSKTVVRMFIASQCCKVRKVDCGPYWKKLKSQYQRQVIKFETQILHSKMVEPMYVIGRTHAGECQEVTDKVGLIEVPTIESKLTPIGSSRGVNLSQ